MAPGPACAKMRERARDSRLKTHADHDGDTRLWALHTTDSCSPPLMTTKIVKESVAEIATRSLIHRLTPEGADVRHDVDVSKDSAPVRVIGANAETEQKAREQ